MGKGQYPNGFRSGGAGPNPNAAPFSAFPQARGIQSSCHDARRSTDSVILLSFFDGVGSAALACKRLGVVVKAFLSWENDTSCVRVVQHHFPEAQHMGDFEKTPAAETAALVQNLRRQHPGAQLLVCAGPPCPDYSLQMKGDDAKGMDGESGRLFQVWCEWLTAFELAIQYKCSILVECVLMKPEWATHFDTMLQANHVVGDACDWGVISRPRLWWTRILWPSGPIASQMAANIKWPQLEWKNFNNQPKLVMHDKNATANDTRIPVDKLTFPESVQSGQTIMPCMTTPAPTDEGRPPPKKCKQEKPESADTLARWKAGNRQFAPWHYRKHHMMLDEHGNLQIPSAEAKELMHKLPGKYTKIPQNTDRDRHRQLGNGWHMGVATRMMWLVLLAAGIIQPANGCMFSADPWYYDTPLVNIPRTMHPDGARPIERAAKWWLHSGCAWGPLPRKPQQPLIPVTASACQHIEMARKMPHPASLQTPLEPSLQYALFMQLWIGSDLDNWRQQVIDDLQELVLEVQADSEAWLLQLPEHIRRAYSHGISRHAELDPSKAFQALPTLILLRLLDFPQWQQLAQELSFGFQMMGPLPTGPNWLPRTDKKYAHPEDRSSFMRANNAHIERTCLAKPRLEHWETMLKEITEEWDLNRIDGPFKAPETWPLKTVSPDEVKWPLYDAKGPIFAAKSFAISQIGSDDQAKIRRGEDWLRSAHNSTVQALDQPTHHTVQDFAELGVATNHVLHATARDVLRCPLLDLWLCWPQPPDSTLDASLRFLQSDTCILWPLLSGNDHEGAYRNFPLRYPEEAYLMLWTPEGLTLWRHNVLLFGSTASVWAYNRMGDVMCFLSRSLGMVPMLHYVDDYGSVDAPPVAQSAFHFFVDFNALLNLRTKPSKAQEPATTHKMQGVDITMGAKAITVAPTVSRKAKLTKELQRCADNNEMSPDVAGRSAGKLVFIGTTTFGRVGRAPTKQLYQRQHMPAHIPIQLTNALEVAIRTIISLLATVKPRTVSCDGARQGDVIYADAFFQMGDDMKAVHQATLEPGYDPKTLTVNKFRNGWGAVWMPAGDTSVAGLAIRGEVPPNMLQRFATNKAYIYFLEAFAQIITAFFFCTVMDDLATMFIDNEAAKHAIIKGYCRERAMCNLLGCFWCLCGHTGLTPWMERVTSEANPSDEISRDVWDMVFSEKWTVLKIDLQPTIRIFNMLAEDSEFAHKSAPQALRREMAKQAVPQIWKHHPHLLRLDKRSSCVVCRNDCPQNCHTCLWRCCESCSQQMRGCLCQNDWASRTQ